ncbi:MAG: YIP1 family protein [Candidatus Melainabacteria bacterium]|nr:YIP1 family protein [Candidatus Melainabacteria bacterium]
MSFLHNTYSVLFRPQESFRDLSSNYSSGLLLQGLGLIIFISLIYQEPSIPGVLAYSSSWLIATSLIFLLAYIFKLEASAYPRFLALLAFAHLPLIFFAPASILSNFNFVLGSLAQLGILIWTFSLNIIAIAELCQISKLKASLIFLLPPLAVALLVFKFALGLIADIIQMLK